MSIPTSIIENTPSKGLTPTTTSDVRGRQAAEQLGKEFESMLLLQMVRSMRQALLDEQGPDDGLGAGTMTDTFDVEFASQLSGSTGLGLARLIADQISHQAGLPRSLSPGLGDGAPVGTATREPGPVHELAPLGRADALVTTAGETGATLSIPLPSPVTSPFGWRADPLVGGARFHRGIDLKAAYGREVPTAAAGRVLYAGEQGGYGQTVVVEHERGYQTRYAHLSAIDVAVGQELATGAIVGRVGQTGRATGPHLHFEVSRDGQIVNPEELARTTS